MAGHCDNHRQDRYRSLSSLKKNRKLARHGNLSHIHERRRCGPERRLPCWVRWDGHGKNHWTQGKIILLRASISQSQYSHQKYLHQWSPRYFYCFSSGSQQHKNESLYDGRTKRTYQYGYLKCSNELNVKQSRFYVKWNEINSG